MNLEEAARWLPPARLALRELVAARRTLVILEGQLVRSARLGGASWTDLAQDLQLTRQGARQRHLTIDPRATGRRPRSAFRLDGDRARANTDR